MFDIANDNDYAEYVKIYKNRNQILIYSWFNKVASKVCSTLFEMFSVLNKKI